MGKMQEQWKTQSDRIRASRGLQIMREALQAIAMASDIEESWRCFGEIARDAIAKADKAVAD